MSDHPRFRADKSSAETTANYLQFVVTIEICGDCEERQVPTGDLTSTKLGCDKDCGLKELAKSVSDFIKKNDVFWGIVNILRLCDGLHGNQFQNEKGA